MIDSTEIPTISFSVIFGIVLGVIVNKIISLSYSEIYPCNKFPSSSVSLSNIPSFCNIFTDVLDNNSIPTLHKFSTSEHSLQNLLKIPLFLSISEYIASQQNKYDKFSYVCVSLSGGVDSMVIAYVCAILHKLDSNKYPFQTIALHINYSNRSESDMEANFVEVFCSQLNIIFHKMTIDDMTRGKIARDVYEEETRNIRYGFYKEMIDKYNFKGILVGHHAGDVVENVFTNMMKGRTLIDICVMHSESIVNNVVIWRPMLHHFKKDIFDFAHSYGIPYFKDTTPDWSNRGIMRNELFPSLDKQYGEVFRNNLYKLGMQANEEGSLITEKVIQPFLQNNVTNGKFATHINLNGFTSSSYGDFFWSTIMMHILHKKSISMITNGSLSLLVKGIHSGKDHCINLAKDLFGYVKGENLFITFGKFARCNSSKKYLDNIITTEQEWMINLRETEFVKYNEINLKEFLNGKIDYIYPIDKENKDCRNELFGKVKTDFRRVVEILPLKLMKSIPFVVPTKTIKLNSETSDEITDGIHVKIEYMG